ncbi:hypothetical protein AK812_SmicGene29738 [Symbiodinium microadriaticum]|uniref:Uncharacterized protein n=1 Tax=Symbiodinium microadriaticum TaxID=2951 RepID=A0A1Q9D145_SYMMI|nr:hypothetical protein AK812_SmicGene29738 [Symbiodinium microadriaticum]
MASDDEMWWEELERAEEPSPGSEEAVEFFWGAGASVPSSRRWRDLRWRHRMLEKTDSPTRLGRADSPTSEEATSLEKEAVEEEGSQQREEEAMAVEGKVLEPPKWQSRGEG